ncbi:MAG: hypothetical protein ACK5U7_12125 [Bacteroidota bacterium]|jgi:hypothetical protein
MIQSQFCNPAEQLKRSTVGFDGDQHGTVFFKRFSVHAVTGQIPMMSTPNMMLRFIDEEENEQFAWVGYRRQGTVTTSNAPYNWEVDVITTTAPGNGVSNCDWFEVDYASGGFQWETVDLLPVIVGFPVSGNQYYYKAKYGLRGDPCDGLID